MPRWFTVIDGADHGRIYALPDAGSTLIGNSHKHADICLHDLYVARVHCEVTINNGTITVTDHQSNTGTRVNGAVVTQHTLQIGDVVRVGNSHLRLEEGERIVEHEEPRKKLEVKPEAPAPQPAKEKWKSPPPPPDHLEELSGRTLSHYQIGELLGKGQYGVVFQTEDIRTKQPVALKVLAPTFPGNDDELRRFANSLKKVLPLHHPGLISLRGIGKTGAHVWMARDLVEGESLADMLAGLKPKPKLKWRRAFRLALQLVPVLEFLRAQRLVHANITPTNILLPADKSPARLADLGLWDALAGTKIQGERLEKKLLAELSYLSPEHFEASAHVDDLSDQYCLGALLYARLIGRPPFAGAKPDETIARVRSATPVRPSEYQEVPDDFQAIVLRMLAKHPEYRYPSPQAILEDLDKVAARHGETE